VLDHNLNIISSLYMSTLIEPRPNLSVGRHSFHNGSLYVSAAEEAPVVIGSFCAFGRNLTIMPVNHDWRFAAIQGHMYKHFFNCKHPGVSDSPSRQRTKGGVYIGSDVWMADNVTILGGVSIGDGACIGAGSVVTKSVPAFAICAGVPAKIIKDRFPKNIAEHLSALKWWEWSDEKIKRNSRFFMTDLSSLSLAEFDQIVALEKFIFRRVSGLG
jgi:virginiamycin A acetyltransferase